MTRGDDVFHTLQAKARSTASKTGAPTPTQEYMIRHLHESFLDRLGRSGHGDDFVLKGGILLAAYGVRRPTKDADANASQSRRSENIPRIPAIGSVLKHPSGHGKAPRHGMFQPVIPSFPHRNS